MQKDALVSKGRCDPEPWLFGRINRVDLVKACHGFPSQASPARTGIIVTSSRQEKWEGGDGSSIVAMTHWKMTAAKLVPESKLLPQLSHVQPVLLERVTPIPKCFYTELG